MHAVLWYGRRDVRYETVPDAPQPGPGEIRVRVAYAGVCGTDLEEYRAGPILIPVGTPHPLTHKKAPIILGHEFAGVVESVGPGVTNLSLGDHVAADVLIRCGRCPACKQGQYNLCEQQAALGQMADGGLADLVTAPAYSFVKLADHVPLDQAALAEPLAVAVRGARRAQIRPGDRVLVQGAGCVGLLAAQVVRAFGAKSVEVVESRPARRELAIALGADHLFDPTEPLPKARFDKVLECSGNVAAQQAGIEAVRPQGRVVWMGITKEPTPLNSFSVVFGEREIVGSLSHTVDEDFQAAVGLLTRGAVEVAPLISRRVPLSETAGVFTALDHDDIDDIKILLRPGSFDEEAVDSRSGNPSVD